MVVHKWFVVFFFALLPVWFALWGVPMVRILALAWILFWLAKNLIQRRFFLPQPTVLFFWSAFLLWATLSVFWALNPMWAIRKVAFWWNIFPLFLVFVDVFREQYLRLILYRSLFFAGLLAAGIGLFQFSLQLVLPVGQLFHFWVDTLAFFVGGGLGNTLAEYPSLLVNIHGVTLLRASAFFPDPHIFAYFVGMLLPLVLWQSRRFALWKRVLFGSMMFAALGLSFSRSGYVGLIIATVYAMWQSRSLLTRYVTPLRTGFVVLGVSVLMFSPVASRFASSFSLEDGSVSERVRLLREAVVNIQVMPFAGVGLGSYPLLVKPTAEFREPIYVHNMYFDIAVEIGFVGLILFLGLLVAVFAQRQKSATLPVASSTWVMVSLVLFFAQSLFENPLFSVHITPLFLALLALLYVESTPQDTV
jgi:O-antigen ligase